MESPSSVNTRVMPTLRPTNPKLMLFASCPKVPDEINNDECRVMNEELRHSSLLSHASQLYFNVHAGRQIELHERVHGLVGGIDDVHQPRMRADLQLLARCLV